MTTPRPTVTFAVPAYNRPELLAETLEGIAAQSDAAEWDVVVCDDLGRDDTRDVVARFPSGRFQYVRNPGPPGAVANWNRCLAAGRGDWVTVLHEDDGVYPWYLDAVAPRLAPGTAAVAVRTVQAAARPELARPRSPGAAAALPYPPRYFIKSSMSPFPGVMVRRSAARALGGFDARWGPLADYEFWYRLACSGPVEVVRVRAAFYRVAPGQWTERAWTDMVRLTHLLRLRIAREQFGGSPRLGLWLARFFSFRNAESYARRFAERPESLRRALRLGAIRGSGLPSGWVWRVVRWTA